MIDENKVKREEAGSTKREQANTETMSFLTSNFTV
jgi:hypothetical protein